MDTQNIEKFDPTQAELSKMVTESKGITEKSDPLVIRDMRLKLKNARVAISKRGKELREEAIAYQKAVINKEKELIGLIEPEEERLSGIEEVAKAIKEKEGRINLLPMRRERIKELGIEGEYSDDFLCELDTVGFQEWTNERVAAQNEAKRLELEAKERAIKEAEEKIAREKEMKEREERAREEEKRLAEERIKQAEERAKQAAIDAEMEKQAAIEAVRQEEARKAAEAEKKRLIAIEEEKMKKAEEARKEAEEKKKREEDERYRKWLADNGATPDVQGWIAMKDPYGANQMVLYKEVSRFDL